MGTSISLKCSKCKYEWGFALGVSMWECDHPEEIFGGNAEPHLSKMVKDRGNVKKAFAIIDNGGIPSRDYAWEIYYCPKCNELHNYFHFEIENDNEKFEPDYRCSACNNALVLVKHEHDTNGVFLKAVDEKRIDWHCPHCKNDKLEYSEDDIIMYD